jgi:hypothetical protein
MSLDAMMFAVLMNVTIVAWASHQVLSVVVVAIMRIVRSRRVRPSLVSGRMVSLVSQFGESAF